MHGVDFVTALGRLLRDAGLRDRFADSPSRLAKELQLTEADRHAFTMLAPDEIDRQARTLLGKRFHEVSKLIPKTIALLGCEAEAIFHRYAAESWPEGSERHWKDAGDFCAHLCCTGRAVRKEELNRIRFRLSGRRISLRFVRRLSVRAGERPGLQILYRDREERIHQLAIYLSL